MPVIPSIVGLHMRYRLWIAELNHDLDILRIFNDYLEDNKEEVEKKKRMGRFNEEFRKLRGANDDLRHEMHLLKMKLAADLRDNRAYNFKNYQSDNHIALKKRYMLYHKEFNYFQKEFKNFFNGTKQTQ